MIIDYFNTLIYENFGFTPTPEQSQVIKKLTQFILSVDDNGQRVDNSSMPSIFVLRGYAGTGKTSLIGALVRTIKQLKRQCVLLAPTGRAAKVFSLYSEHPAYTIHKRIYRQKSIDLDSPFSLDFNSMKHTLFIVDEASMISTGNNPSNGNALYNRSLLDDLVEFVYSREGCRLILLGDTAQLPPVGEYESPALQSATFNSMGFNVTCATLTQVVRQHEQSGILENATNIRTLINSDDIFEHQHLLQENLIPKIKFTKDVTNIPGNELIETLSHCYHEYGTDDTIVICRSNKRANVYNNGIRREILDRESELSNNDMIMIAKNNYFWLKNEVPQLEQTADDDESDETINTTAPFLANGDIAKVVRVRNERELYGFRFADVELILPDYNDMEIEATVLLDTLHSESPSLTYEQNEKLFNNIMEDYMDIPYKRDRLKKMKEDPYYNALQIKYAYAVTCHKAQGGQWSQVFIDQGYISDDMIGIDYYRWLYTAFTRATDHVYLVNWKQDEDE